MATRFHQRWSKSWLRTSLWGTVGWCNNSHESTGFPTRLDELSHNVSSAREEPAVNDPQYFTAAWRSGGCLYVCSSVFADTIQMFVCGKTGNQPEHCCWEMLLLYTAGHVGHFFFGCVRHFAVTLKITRHLYSLSFCSR